MRTSNGPKTFETPCISHWPSTGNTYVSCSYGRTHVVDTVTEPPTHSDEIVTRETLDRDDEKRYRLLSF